MYVHVGSCTIPKYFPEIIVPCNPGAFLPMGWMGRTATSRNNLDMFFGSNSGALSFAQIYEIVFMRS